MLTTTERPKLTAKDAAIIRCSGELKGLAIVLSESEDEGIQELAATLERISKTLFDMV